MKAVNLLPDDNRGPAPVSSPAKPASGGSPFGAYVVLGFLALAIVMVASYVLVGNSIKDRRAELASVQAEAQTIRAQADALKPYAAFRQLAVQRVETVTQLARSRFNWERALRDVSRAIPADVHLKSFDGSVSGATPAGGTPSGTGAPASPSIILASCTSSQPAVAKLMSRLRAVRGVTRVSLTKSEKPLSTSTPAAPVTAGGQVPLCGRGSSKPDFELTMYFERAATTPVAPPSTTPPATGEPATGAQPASAGAATATPTPAPASGSTSSNSQGVTTP